MLYRPGTDEDLCFVLMPFRKPFNGIYTDVIKEAVESTGLSPRRGDEIYGAGSVIRNIWSAIWRARLVIADVTSRNPNVNYELGLCHALEVPTVIITQRTRDVPFDYRQRRYVLYDTQGEMWRQRLHDELSKSITAVLKNNDDQVPELPWPYDAVEAGLNIGATRYQFRQILDDKCTYVLMTGHNFCDQLGSRDDAQFPLLYEELVRFLMSNDRVRVQLKA